MQYFLLKLCLHSYRCGTHSYIRGYSVSGCAIYLFRLRCQVNDDDDENQWPTYAPQNNNGSEKQLQLVMSSRDGKGEQWC